MECHLLAFYCLIKYINLLIKKNLTFFSTLKVSSNKQTANIYFGYIFISSPKNSFRTKIRLYPSYFVFDFSLFFRGEWVLLFSYCNTVVINIPFIIISILTINSVFLRMKMFVPGIPECHSQYTFQKVNKSTFFYQTAQLLFKTLHLCHVCGFQIMYHFSCVESNHGSIIFVGGNIIAHVFSGISQISGYLPLCRHLKTNRDLK